MISALQVKRLENRELRGDPGLRPRWPGHAPSHLPASNTLCAAREWPVGTGTTGKGLSCLKAFHKRKKKIVFWTKKKKKKESVDLSWPSGHQGEEDRPKVDW